MEYLDFENFEVKKLNLEDWKKKYFTKEYIKKTIDSLKDAIEYYIKSLNYFDKKIAIENQIKSLIIDFLILLLKDKKYENSKCFIIHYHFDFSIVKNYNHLRWYGQPYIEYIDSKEKYKDWSYDYISNTYQKVLGILSSHEKL